MFYMRENNYVQQLSIEWRSFSKNDTPAPNSFSMLLKLIRKNVAYYYTAQKHTRICLLKYTASNHKY